MDGIKYFIYDTRGDSNIIRAATDCMRKFIPSSTYLAQGDTLKLFGCFNQNLFGRGDTLVMIFTNTNQLNAFEHAREAQNFTTVLRDVNLVTIGLGIERTKIEERIHEGLVEGHLNIEKDEKFNV